ncbi:hypothetical protein WL29_21375 [Burkholderia ubonensis]|uniref:Uncharacterized protein n=1 Tax=Burkholderia ubonensis TaxID=101571 RepID=A0A106QBG5_9BURK|nr:hypothetical protein [Burkholderia ubonensis]KWA83920.1 hypothetical protein WL29_21375 [Burkholderia ubonensis]
MKANFALWTACQRLYNVTPVVVEDLREMLGEVRFLANLRNDDGTEVEDLYDDSDILAIGNEDEEGFIRLVAVEDFFFNERCIVVARAAASYLEDNAKALEVIVFVSATDATRQQAVQLVREASLEGAFENRWARRLEASAREEETRKQLALRAEEEARARAVERIERPYSPAKSQQGRSLLDRWFGKN